VIPIERAKGLVFTENDKIYTISLSPGIRVYGEKLKRVGDLEYREWDPRRSKLSAYLKVGGKFFPLHKNTNVLYLGASSGTTASHVSDIVSEGKVYCVEFAPRMFRGLVNTCASRPNMAPILGDAMAPQDYSFAIDKVDIVYSDVAQKRQVDIIADNMDRFGAKCGMVTIKARSENVALDPHDVFKSSEKRLVERGFEILESVGLEPYENAHQMIVFKKD